MASASLIGYSYSRHPLSTPGQPFVAKSTLTAVTYIPGKDKRLIFASEWNFNGEGIRDVKLKFEDALKKNHLIANHEWDDEDKVFRVRCIVGDTSKVSTIFSGILSDIVRESHGDDYLSDEEDGSVVMVSNSDGEEEPFKSTKIERISTWSKRHGIAELESQFENTLAITNKTPDPKINLVNSLRETGSNKSRVAWIFEDTHRHLDDVASDDILEALKSLTGCDFAKDPKNGALLIEHSSVENCQLVITKLDNLKKYSEPRKPFQNHLFYTEDIRNFHLVLCRFTDIKSKFFRTTLLHPYKMGPIDYPKLTRALTVRCAPWDELKASYVCLRMKKVVPVTKNPNRASNPMEYRGKGDLESHPLRQFIDDEDSQTQNNNTRPEIGIKVIQANPNQINQARIEGWAQKILLEAPCENLGGMVGGLIHSSGNLPVFQSNPATDRALSWDTYPLFDPSEPKKENLSLPNGFLSSSEDHGDRSLLAPLAGKSTSANFVESLLDDDMPRISIAPLQPLRHVTGPLALEPPSSPTELAASMTYPTPATQCSQSQRTVQPLILDPIPEFFTDINASFRDLIRGLQGFPGEVVVQAEFGRIILRKINSRLITSEETLESFPSQELLDLLLPKPPKNGKQGTTFFSNILTILPTDMTYLVDMKNRDGEPMWENKLAEWSIFYEISCHNEGLAGWHPFSIEIDGDTFSTRIKTRYDFGALNIHGTRRHWDFRLVAFGFGNDEQNKELYEDFASDIQTSLYIPPKNPKPSLYFKLDDSFAEDSKLVIDSILVHRITKHKSTDREGSILSISEVRALDVDSRYPFDGAKFQVYRALSPLEHQNGTDCLDVWYEASISSAKANDLLRQNVTLELGDEAGWTPEKLEQLGAASAMYLPACEMLKQMDGIGLHNNNGIDLREARPPSETIQQPNLEYFW